MMYLPVGNSKICNVKDYGAVGDGVANDTKPIQSAISDPSCMTIHFPANHTFLSFPLAYDKTGNFS